MFCHNFDSPDFASLVKWLGKVNNFYAALLSVYCEWYLSNLIEIKL